MARLRATGVGDGDAHRRGDPPVPGVAAGPAAGFGQGRCLDEAAPCTALSGLADDASGEDRDFKDVTDDQLLGVLGARKRLEARQAWEIMMAVAEFIRRRPKDGCPLEGPARMPRVWDEHAAGELRAELHLTQAQADELLGLAYDLTVKLPLTSAALRDGIIDFPKARLITLRCLPLAASEAAAAEAILFASPEIAEWTYGMIRDRIARAVIQVNPQAAIRRREDASKARRIEVWAEDSGNAALVGRELPPAAVLAANQLLTARARELRASGLDGGMDELRVLAYLERLGVLDPLAPSAAPVTGPGAGGEHADEDPGGGESGGGEDPGGGGSSGGRGPAPGGTGGSTGGAGLVPGPPAGGLAAHVNLTVPLATALGLAERPGILSRIDPLDPNPGANT